MNLQFQVSCQKAFNFFATDFLLGCRVDAEASALRRMVDDLEDHQSVSVDDEAKLMDVEVN